MSQLSNDQQDPWADRVIPVNHVAPASQLVVAPNQPESELQFDIELAGGSGSQPAPAPEPYTTQCALQPYLDNGFDKDSIQLYCPDCHHSYCAGMRASLQWCLELALQHEHQLQGDHQCQNLCEDHDQYQQGGEQDQEVEDPEDDGEEDGWSGFDDEETTLQPERVCQDYYDEILWQSLAKQGELPPYQEPDSSTANEPDSHQQKPDCSMGDERQNQTQ